MSEKLKPCPFCGSTEVYVEEYEHHPGAVRWRVLCAGCMAGIDTGTRQSAGDAVLDWNRRAERTCRVECYPPGYEDNLHYEVCSECGTILTASRPGDRHAARASYCPGCGARIEEEVRDADR